MLLHITPRYYLKYSDVLVDLLDVSIPELNLILKAGEDLVVRTPHRNKCYKVACRKKGRKALNGIFIETDVAVRNFTVVTRWIVNASISTHVVHYHINDDEFDAATEEEFFWSGFSATPYRTRKKNEEGKESFSKRQPAMITDPEDFEFCDEESHLTYNESDDAGIIRYRTETYNMPSVERERLCIPFWGNKRLPLTEHSFNARLSNDYKLTVVPGEFMDLSSQIVPFSEWINEVMREKGDEIEIRILKEINARTPVFFSNTNDLFNKAVAYSDTFTSLSDDGKKKIEFSLNQPIFHITYE